MSDDFSARGGLPKINQVAQDRRGSITVTGKGGSQFGDDGSELTVGIAMLHVLSLYKD